ncbi:periplasmic nitrate reductase subunit NapB [Volucribacter psittacicida]|uniref:Periplasmic nitrate reductase, electron transfer subunit n=1 Tax=Volucribacter psittacicida TaxID=203482 RepID=A0A4R1FM37_9PAST|nr:nitrate reductase cytochrome c-type subunit [Volucribacter psittacicida]TCJ95877.1 periplasmic nitrate reductase subunit NapB [Volucribacter psittacicida]
MIKKTMLILTAFFASNLLANEGNIGHSLQDSPENVTPGFNMPKKESELAPLNYVNQPPMIPHAVKGYQISKNVNQCLMCHSVEGSRVTGATRISPTHFADRDGNIVAGQTAPRRYFCLHCHVSQSDVEPIVPNDFQPMPGYGK